MAIDINSGLLTVIGIIEVIGYLIFKDCLIYPPNLFNLEQKLFILFSYYFTIININILFYH